jgi:hypothetical protein
METVENRETPNILAYKSKIISTRISHGMIFFRNPTQPNKYFMPIRK